MNPRSRGKQHSHQSVSAATVCASTLRSVLCSFSRVASCSGNCVCPPPPFCQAGPFHCCAKFKPALRERELDSVRSGCLMCHPWPRAMKWRGSYAQQSESAPLLTVCVSPRRLSFFQTNRISKNRLTSSLNENPYLSPFKDDSFMFRGYPVIAVHD